MDNNLNKEEMVLLYFLLLFLSSHLFLKVEAGIPCFKRKWWFDGIIY